MSRHFEIRKATPQDAAAIGEIWNHYIRDTLATFNSAEKSQDEIADLIARRPAFVVAEQEGMLLGFATFDQFRGGVGYVASVEHTVLLAPNQSGRGIGRALMVVLEQIARAQSRHVLVAGVSGSNPKGVAFHTAIGFETSGVLPEVGQKFGTYHDLVLMQKILR